MADNSDQLTPKGNLLRELVEPAGAARRTDHALRLFCAATAGFLLLLLGLNAGLLGGDIAIHWDTLHALQMGSPAVPDKAAMATHREHLYDVCAVARSDDPAVVTAYWTPGSAPFRNDLVALRRYYWQVGNVVNQAVFFLAATFISDPGKALFAYQLAPLLLMAATFGLLLTYIVRRFLGLSQEAPGATKPLFVALFWILPPLVAIATAPVFLSLSRQLLTETLGFAFMVPGLLLMGHAMQPVRTRQSAVLLAVAAAVLLYLAVRTRYSLGPFIVLLIPLMVLCDNALAQLMNHKARLVLVSAAACGAVAVLVALDVRHFGPYMLPGVYSDVMVKSARLFFHDPGHYTYFISGLFVDAVPIIIPLIGMVCLVFASSWRMRESAWQWRIVMGYAFLVVAIMIYMLVLTARKEVVYQPRHLFPFLAGFLCTLVFLLPQLAVTGRRIAGCAFALLCLGAFGLNAYSAFGPQRQILTFNPPVMLSIFGTDAPASIKNHRFEAALERYYDFGDNRRLHDSVEVIAYLQQRPPVAGSSKHLLPLLLVDSGILLQWNYMFMARSFGGAEVRLLDKPFAADDESAVNAALAAGRQVFIVSPFAGCSVPKEIAVRQVPLELDLAVLRQIISTHDRR